MTSSQLTDEQRLLHDTVSALAADLQAKPEAVAEQRARTRSWDTIGELGLLTMRWPEAAAGAGVSSADVALVAEALGRTPAVVPFAGPVLAAELLLRADVDADTLSAIWAAGPLTIALDADTMELPIRGPVAWDAAGAAQVVCLRDDPDRGLIVVVDAAGDEQLPSADLTRVVRTVGSAGSDAYTIHGAALDRWTAFALTVVSADLVGVMAGALDISVQYATDRKQFGTPIGAFQALAHLMADAHVQLEAARSATRHAAWAVDALEPREALLAARVAKAYAARVALGVTEVAVQVHGGIGTTWESRCHLFVRRALTGTAVLGDEQRQLVHISAARLGEG